MKTEDLVTDPRYIEDMDYAELIIVRAMNRLTDITVYSKMSGVITFPKGDFNDKNTE